MSKQETGGLGNIIGQHATHSGACEECWRDACERQLQRGEGSIVEHYHALLREREDNLCLDPYRPVAPKETPQ